MLESAKTPLVLLDSFGQLAVYAKLENTEPSGSIKYRTVSRMLDDAITAGTLKQGMGVIEITSGNTGIALALKGKELGYHVAIVTVKDATERAKSTIAGYGAELVEVDGWFADAQKVVNERMAREPGKWFWLQQMSNPSSLAANYDLGIEISKQFRELFGGSIDAYIGSVSSGSTITGVDSAGARAARAGWAWLG